jgi:predicted ferric reductase
MSDSDIQTEANPPVTQPTAPVPATPQKPAADADRSKRGGQRSDEETAAILDAMLTRYSWQNVIISLVLGLGVGLGVAWFVLPTYLEGMVMSITGDAPKVYWYLSRSAGVVAYLLVWLSVVWGLLLTTTIGKMLGQVAPIVDLHRHLSWLAVTFALVHAIVLLGDQYITYTLTTLFVPYADTAYRPLAVALGQIGWYALLLVTVSFWVRTWTGQKVWRAIHYLSFGVFVLVAVHAIYAGTDSDALYYLYVGTAISVLFLTILRMVNTK